jgi:hypothetical protein
MPSPEVPVVPATSGVPHDRLLALAERVEFDEALDRAHQKIHRRPRQDGPEPRNADADR